MVTGGEDKPEIYSGRKMMILLGKKNSNDATDSVAFNSRSDIG